MRIQYSFRTEDFKLPDERILFNTVRNIHERFIEDPTKTFEEIRKWARPMNQLQNGLFLSINEETGPYPYVNNQETNESRLEMKIYYIADYFARIIFDYEESFPYRVSSQHVRI